MSHTLQKLKEKQRDGYSLHELSLTCKVQEGVSEYGAGQEGQRYIKDLLKTLSDRGGNHGFIGSTHLQGTQGLLTGVYTTLKSVHTRDDFITALGACRRGFVKKARVKTLCWDDPERIASLCQGVYRIPYQERPFEALGEEDWTANKVGGCQVYVQKEGRFVIKRETHDVYRVFDRGQECYVSAFLNSCQRFVRDAR